MSVPAPSPEFYQDDIARRIFPMRFRRIGNPYAFLNEVGIIPVLEYIYKGHLLLEVAEVLNVSYTVLRTWAEKEGHLAAIDEAEKVSAEGFLAHGQRLLREAQTSFELGKAREIIRHAQYMASKKNKPLYGTDKESNSGGGVSYVFNINGNVTAPQVVELASKAKEAVEAIDVEATPIPRVSFNFLEHLKDNTDSPDDTPIGMIDWDEPTADEPETGPFYE